MAEASQVVGRKPPLRPEVTNSDASSLRLIGHGRNLDAGGFVKAAAIVR
jgi:hypothetical protein